MEPVFIDNKFPLAEEEFRVELIWIIGVGYEGDGMVSCEDSFVGSGLHGGSFLFDRAHCELEGASVRALGVSLQGGG